MIDLRGIDVSGFKHWRSPCGTILLINGDSREVLPNLPVGCVSVVATDPPFGVRRPSDWRSVSERFTEIDGNDAVDCRWIDLAYPLIQNGGAVYSFCTWDTLEQWRQGLTDAGLRVRSCIVWDKGVHGLGDLETCWAPRHELVLFAAKGRHELHGNRPVDIVRCNRLPAGDLQHPYQKPVPLMSELLRTNTGTVLDPHCGVGTTGVACARDNRPLIGIEIDTEHGYFDIAVDRCKAELSRQPLFQERPKPVQRSLLDEVPA